MRFYCGKCGAVTLLSLAKKLVTNELTGNFIIFLLFSTFVIPAHFKMHRKTFSLHCFSNVHNPGLIALLIGFLMLSED